MQLNKIRQLARPLLLALLCALAGKGYAQTFRLVGTTKDNDGKWLYLYYAGQHAGNITDSVQIKKDSYLFSGMVDGPTMAYIGLKEPNGRLNAENSYGFFLEPGAIKLTQIGDHLKNSSVTGSKAQQEYQVLVDQEDKLDHRWQVVMDTLRDVNKRSNTAYQELKDWVLLPYFAAREDLEMSFFKAHPQNAATAYLLRFYVSKMKLDTLQRYYNALGSRLQASPDGKELAREMSLIRKGSPGSMATDFEAIDLNGKPLQLSTFKGKYVLLDFWASWCVPCRQSNPHLKALYHTYHDRGLDIIGVSDDDGALDKWKAAVSKDGVNLWHNVLRGYNSNFKPGAFNPSDISAKFGVQVLPTKILIDPNGKIIGRFTGTEDEPLLDTALIKAFGNT